MKQAHRNRPTVIIITMSLILIAGSSSLLFAGNRFSTAPNRMVDPIVTTTQLDADVIDSLLHMREEEKLARDVYLTLAEYWGQRIFSSIASSEQRHMDSVASLLTAFGIEDPVKDPTIGAFTNPLFTQLYEDLIEQGTTSLADAYRVGIAIEELDIEDLEEQSAFIDDLRITQVYDSLLRGSWNHLGSFQRQLDAVTMGNHRVI